MYKFCFEQKDFQKAEAFFLRAQRPELAVKYYKVSMRARLASEKTRKEFHNVLRKWNFFTLLKVYLPETF